MMMDTLIDRFEEEAEDKAIVGPADVERFLEALNEDMPSDLTFIFELSKIALELSWMRWPERLNCFAAKLSPEDVLQKFRNLPTAQDFFPLFTNDIRARVDALAESEFRLRSTYGDCIPAEHYAATYSTTICTPMTRNLRRVTSDFRSASLNTTLHGLCLFGRQRSTDPDDLQVEKRPEGRRIIIAPRRENRVSRNQMSLQLLSPDFAIVQNTSTTNKLALEHREKLDLGEKRLVRFPFVVTLPHQRLNFH